MKNKILIMTLFLSTTAFAGGGTINDSKSGIIFNYVNVTSEVATQELQYCREVAMSTQKTVQSPQGSGLRGAARGAAAGATIGAVSGGSGSDGAKTGAAIGVVGGRLSGRKAEQNQHAENDNQYETILRNCMTQKQYVPFN